MANSDSTATEPDDSRDQDQDVESHYRHSESSASLDLDDTFPHCDCTEEKTPGRHDGHRPCGLEMRPSHTRSVRSPRDSGLTTGADSAAAAATGRPRPQQALRRTLSRRDTALSKIRSRPSIAPFSHPLAHQKTTDAELVDFEGPDDPYHPLNWPANKKIGTTLLYGLVTMSATWASSAYSAGTQQISQEFRVSEPVAILGTTLFLLGFGLGPLLWAPLSEVYGRRAAVLTPMFVGICFSFGSATAKDFQTLMITRFFGAFFSSAPVSNTGGVLGDLFTPAYRGYAMAGYAMAVVGGPTVGPIVSAAVVAQPGLGWRWTEYITGILQSSILVFAVVFVDETYPSKLLVRKAVRLRHETGNWALHARFEEWDVSVSELAGKFLSRPVRLLATPICFLVALYASFCYGILYMQLGSIPLIFADGGRGWSPVVAVLPFLGILVGSLLGAAVNSYNQLIYNKSYHAAGDRAVPEKRLPPMMLGSVLFAAGQFVTGWTGPRTDIHWIVPVLGLVLTGLGFNTIFQAALNYLVDTFQMYAASAIAANTFLRSCFAAAFPLVVGPLYRSLGVGPGSSIFAGFATLLIPVPFVFYVFGRRIRAGSKWSKASVW